MRARHARHILLAIAAGLALADAAVVTLALPELLRELNTTVEGVAAVLGVYTVVLAASLLPAERLQRRIGAPRTAASGLALFALASVVCSVSTTLGLLLAARAAQAMGGAAALVAAYELLVPHGASQTMGRRLWLGAAVLSSAIGPALGGLLTEALSWRAIFYVQAPIAAAAALAALTEPRRPPAAPPPPRPGDPQRFTVGPSVALAFVSAALTAVLFLLVLLLVAAWDITPLRAALAVTVIPASALVGARVRGGAAARATAGCALVGAGVLALAFLPDAHIAWTIAPQIAAGLGMGLALPALGGELLPERDAHDAARLLLLRHIGIALALALLAPVVSHDLDAATEHAQERGVAVILDARLSPTDKLRLAPALLNSVETDRPRAGLSDALAQHRRDIKAGDRPAYDEMAQEVDDVLVLAVGEAFRTAFLVTGALALLAALAILPWPAVRRGVLAPLLLGVTIALPVSYFALHAAVAPAAVELRDPCGLRPLPATGGLQGFLQDRVLELLDTTACKAGSTREELVLALTDKAARKRYEARYGVDPRSLSSLLSLVLR